MRADYLGLKLLFDVFVGVKVGCLVLTQLVVVVLVVEVLGTYVGVLRQGVSELFYDFLEACPGLAWVFFLEGSVGVDLEQFNLLVDVVHCALEVALLAVGGEIEGLERREGTHKLLVGEPFLVLPSDLADDCRKLFSGEVYPMLLDERNKCRQGNSLGIVPIN